MKADYHIHPNLLKQPEQADLFINRAIELGFDEICFTDHMPFTVTGDEHDRIPFGKVSEYCMAVREKAEIYKERIIIKTGIEIDYHPSCIAEIEDVLSQGEFDYVLGSSHMNIKGFGVPFGKITKNQYAQIVLKNYSSAAQSGYFNTISHLDVYRCFFADSNYFSDSSDEYTYQSCVELLCEIFLCLEKNGVCLELNAAPLYKKFDNLGIYPQTNILDIAKSYKLNYVYGSDAHTYDKVGYGYDKIYSAKKVRDEIHL